MPVLRFLFVLVFFALPVFVFAQDAAADEAAKEKLRRQTALLEQILSDAKNFRLPENRAFIYAKAGNSLWQSDEKRARQFFQNSIAELIAAQAEVENEKGNNKQFLNNLIYGQSPRWEILYLIASRDADFALDALARTRPNKLVQAVSNFSPDNVNSPSQQFARNEIQNEQRLIALAAEQSPQRAIKLLRESLKKEVSYDTINLLKRIHQKDAETANQLAEEVGQKLLDTKFDESNQDSSFMQYFLAEFGQKQTTPPPASESVSETHITLSETNSIKVSDQLLRDLSDKIVKFILRPNATSFYGNENAFKVIERFFPAAVAQIRQRQTKFQNQTGQSEDYNKLMQSDATSEELLSRAEKFPVAYQKEIYRRAAEKTAQAGNVAQAQKILTSNLPDEEEADRYLSQLNYNLANQAISQSKFDDANAIINQIPDENLRLSAFVYLANSVYQKNPKENQKWALSILEQARGLVPDAPEKFSEINSLLSLASAYAVIEPSEAFRLIESLSPTLEELLQASAVLAKFNDYGNFRQGEYQISSGNNG
ncbi:MAG: hypothetical protein M3033_07310, partial [Acidobacteriota bacterium]|nr:hypothetical protein [Acidobacteriota bacterium]